MMLNGVGTETLAEYRVKIEHMASQLIAGEKHLAIWGAGENGERFMRYCNAIHIPAQCLVDNNAALWGTKRWGLFIISPEELGQLQDMVVLISFPSTQVVQEVADQIDHIRGGVYFTSMIIYFISSKILSAAERQRLRKLFPACTKR